MITGAHAVIYSADAKADKAFFKDVLKLPNVNAGRGWLIFGLPPADIAVYPSDKNGTHELFLLGDDMVAFVEEMSAPAISCSPVSPRCWGSVTQLTLPGGGQLAVYEPRHARP